MKILYIYQFCSFGGVERVILNRAKAYQDHKIDINISIGYLYDYGALASFQSYIRTNNLSDMISAFLVDNDAFPDFAKYDLVFNIDTPQIFERNLDANNVYLECHTQNWQYLVGLPHNIKGVIVPSNSFKSVLESEFPFLPPIVVLPNSVENDFFDLSTTMRNKLYSASPIAFLARVDDELKNFHETVHIFDQFVDNPNVIFMVIGRGAEDTNLLNELNDKRILKKTIIRHQIDFGSVPAFVGTVKKHKGVFISSSKAESFGLSAAEFISAGVPVLLTDITPHRELVNNDDNFLYPLGDVISAQKKIQAILNQWKTSSKTIESYGQKFQGDSFITAWHDFLKGHEKKIDERAGIEIIDDDLNLDKYRLLQENLKKQGQKIAWLSKQIRSFLITIEDKDQALAVKDQNINQKDQELHQIKKIVEEMQSRIDKEKHLLTISNKELKENIDASTKSLPGRVLGWLQWRIVRIFPDGTIRGRILEKISGSFLMLTSRKDLKMVRRSKLFDQTFYLANNPDVAASGKDPAKHYLLYGAYEGRNPSPHFSSQWYRDTYADVRISGINPLVHYLWYGQKEGRLPIDPSQLDKWENRSVGESSKHISFIKQIYKRIYKGAGLWLREHISAEKVEFIKRFLPNPDGVPQRLVYSPRPTSRRNIPLGEFEKPTIQSKPDVFILSIIDWNFRHQRPQHIAESLAKSGRRVFYIEQMLSRNGLEIEKIAPSLFKARLSSEHTGHIQPYSSQPNNITIKNWIDALYDLCDAVQTTSFKQVIIHHPFWWQIARHLPPEFQIIYDCMDDIAEFSNTESFILDLEQDLLKNCDRLVVSSQHLFDKYKSIQTPTLIRNAADVENFAESKVSITNNTFSIKTGSLSNNNNQSIKVGYVGAISDWFDVALIRTAAQMDRNIEYHLCGSVTSSEAANLEELPNVHMYGEIKYTDAPKFLNQMDVAIIPFQIIPIIQACDPVKFYEYSALGIPTVTTPLPELARASELTLTATTPESFIHQIYKGYELSKNTLFCENLKQYALENTWEHRNIQFIEILESLPLVSIIILSYGDPSLTVETVSSLYYRGKTYPNMEVLIIDNGSAEEQIIKIKDFTKDLPGLRIIENNENLGFARGNNVGMQQATGEYLMLLNNDTLIPPGTIYAMVRHLEKNPKAGVVGPLTNNIGNEAKVFVEYNGVEQMIQIARKLTTGYRGQNTELDAIAYFAAMFRRKGLELFGYLSEDYGIGMFEDDDHCSIIKSKGFSCLLAEDAFVHHELSATFSDYEGKKELFEKNKAVFEKKWGPWQPHQYRNKRPDSSLSN